MSRSSSSPPGWYPDPAGGPTRKYWDGSTWHNAIPAHPGPRMPKQPTNWKGLGIIAGALVALIVVASIIGGLTGGEDTKGPAPPAVKNEAGSLAGTHSPLLDVALPDGSDGVWTVNDFNKDGQPNHFEQWDVPLSYDATVAYLTDKLRPHYTRPDGMPWFEGYPTEGEIGDRYLDWWWGVSNPELLVRIQDFGEPNQTTVYFERRSP